MGAHEQTGVAGCFSLDEYERDVIKKHERTRRDKEDDRTRHMIELRAQTGVVFLTYRADADGRSTAADASRPATPLYDFTAADGVRHTIWRAGRGADQRRWWTRSRGSRRSTSPTAIIARRARRGRATELGAPGRTAQADAGTFIAVAFPDNQVQILPYNRTVKDLGGRDAAGVPGGAARSRFR